MGLLWLGESFVCPIESGLTRPVFRGDIFAEMVGNPLTPVECLPDRGAGPDILLQAEGAAGRPKPVPVDMGLRGGRPGARFA